MIWKNQVKRDSGSITALYQRRREEDPSFLQLWTWAQAQVEYNQEVDRLCTR